jgi:hypothetical protein
MGVLGADGKPAVKPGGENYSAKEKKALLKKEQEMRNAEMGVTPKPDKNRAKAKRLPPSQDTELAKQKVSETQTGSIVSLKGNVGNGFKTGIVMIPVLENAGKQNAKFVGQQRIGRVKGNWLVEKDGTVSHIPSGLRIGNFANYTIGQGAAEAIMAMEGQMPSKANINGSRQLKRQTIESIQKALIPFERSVADLNQ